MPVEYGDEESVIKFIKILSESSNDSAVVREILEMSFRTYSVLNKQTANREKLKANNLGFRIFEFVEREKERENLNIKTVGLAIESFYINWHLNLLRRLHDHKKNR